MKNIISTLLIALSFMVLIAIVSVVAGTIVYLIWPVAIPAIFPGLVESGTIAGELNWWVAVCFTWLCGTLIKNTQTINK